MLVKIKTTDELIKMYASLINITRTDQQEINFQVILFELEWRAEL